MIIWKKAAEANLVETYGAGICVDSLKELCLIFEIMDESAYNKYAEAAQRLSNDLRNGQFGRNALLSAEDILGL